MTNFQADKMIETGKARAVRCNETSISIKGRLYNWTKARENKIKAISIHQLYGFYYNRYLFPAKCK